MKTKLTLLTIILGFITTSCYTQFGTIRDDEYVVKRERQYKNYEAQGEVQDDTVEAYYDDQDSVAEDEYYEDDAEYTTYVDYHYSSRPYVYLYRFSTYDPWYDDYYYYNQPVTVISIRTGPRYRYYDPYWAGFYCSPYDYCDPWFGWCGYGYISYYPYNYGHYYYDRYYGGYYHGRYWHNSNYYNYRYGRDYYASNWGRRPFTSARAGRLASRPERPARPAAVSTANRPLDMPASRPVVASRPDRETQKDYTLERPVSNGKNTLQTRPAVYRNNSTDSDDRRYKRRYYNSSERIKSELEQSRKQVKRTTPNQPTRDVSGDDQSSSTKTVRRTYKYNRDRRDQQKSVNTTRSTTSDRPTYQRPKTTTPKKYSGDNNTKNRTRSVESSRSSSGEKKSTKSYTPRSGNTKSYTPNTTSRPRSSGSSSSSSSVRSAPSRSSYSPGRSSGSSSSGRSSSGSSSSSGGSRSSSGSGSGKRPR